MSLTISATRDSLDSSLVCRLCIKHSDSFHPIEYIRKSLESILPNLDLSLTNHPVVVCSNCVTLANQCYIFITMCLEKNKKIQDHYNKMVDLDLIVKKDHKSTATVEKNDQNKLKIKKQYQDLTKSISNDENVNQEFEADNIVEIFESDIVSDGESDISEDISEDISLEANSSYKIVDPEKNKKTEETKNDFVVIKDSEDEFEDNDPKVQNLSEINTNYRGYDGVNTIFKENQSLSQQLVEALKSQQKNFKKSNTLPLCLICHKTFMHKQHLNGHLLSKHKDFPDIENIVSSKIHYCPKCPFVTIRNYAVARHIMNHHPKEKLWKKNNCKLFPCEHCDRSFGQKYSLQMHILSCHEDEAPLAQRALKRKIFACELCHFKTLKEKNYQKHLENHNKLHSVIKSFPCEYCNISFRQKDLLQRHILTCHEDKAPLAEQALKRKIFACELCHFKTVKEKNYQKHLENHNKFHSAIKSFPCEHCNISFRQKDLLQRHILRCHEDEAPLAERALKRNILACKPCPLFKEKYLTKPFLCEHCDRTFSQKDLVLTHMQGCQEDKAPIYERASKSQEDVTPNSERALKSKVFACEPCQYKTVNIQKFQMHLKKHNKFLNTTRVMMNVLQVIKTL